MSKSRNTRQFRPALQTMDDRIVPATINLTSQGAEDWANGAIIREYNRESARGQMNGFVRIDRNGVEQGFNGDSRPVQFDEAAGRGRTHSLRLNQVPTVTLGGVVYRSFVLDVQEPVNQSAISLDELRIYTSNSRFLTGYNTGTKTLGGRTAVYDMDAQGDVTVQIDANLNRRNGRGDVFVLIPNSAFAGVGARDYVTLYSKLSGAHGDFEEWSVGRIPRNLVPPPPPTSSGSTLSGFVYQDDLDPETWLGDGIHQTGEFGYVGVTMQLRNEFGVIVATTETDEDGYYAFTNLAAGTYSIVQPFQPTPASEGEEVVDDRTTVGTLGGVAQVNEIINIVVGANQVGEEYNFLEVTMDLG